MVVCPVFEGGRPESPALPAGEGSGAEYLELAHRPMIAQIFF
jgi:hypothetical protein